MIQEHMDEDLQTMSREALMDEARRLRNGIRAHRDTEGHALCWYHPQLWSLLPEKTDPLPPVPEWSRFLEGCIRFRESLDEQAPGAPRTKEKFDPEPGKGEKPMSNPERQVECTIPVLPVEDLQRSMRFYVETLEFKLDWGGKANETICSVSRDGCSIMLMQIGMKSPGVWVWIGLEDDSLFEIYRGRGVKVLQEPRNFSWAYEMKFEDPDGNVLWLGTEPRKDMPMEDQKDG